MLTCEDKKPLVAFCYTGELLEVKIWNFAVITREGRETNNDEYFIEYF